MRLFVNNSKCLRLFSVSFVNAQWNSARLHVATQTFATTYFGSWAKLGYSIQDFRQSLKIEVGIQNFVII